MGRDKVTAVIPCRKGSQRVVNKNTRPFAGFNCGLLELKLNQLAASWQIDDILVTTNDPVVSAYVESIQSRLPKPVLLDVRPDRYAADDSLQELIGYLGGVVDTDVVAWTHVTSPLFGPSLYDAALHAYRAAKQNQSADSLIAVDSVQTFALRASEWISHDPNDKRWPRTQDLEKIFLVNSALFVIDLALMQQRQDRVGGRPFMFETPAPYGFDIDWEDDFFLGEKLFTALSGKPENDVPTPYLTQG